MAEAPSVLRVMPENVTPLWPQIEPLFSEVLAQRRSHDAEDVRCMVISGRGQLWIEWDGERVISAIVTEFVHYPKGLWVRVWLGAARPDARMNATAFQALLTDWARHNKARGFEAIGRHGWLRRFPGAAVEGLVMRLEIEPAA